MSKVKGAALAHVKVAKACDVIHEMSKKLAAKAAKNKGAVAVLAFIAMIVTAHFAQGLSMCEAALYIFANDGKVSGRMSGDVKMRNGRQRGFVVPALVRNFYTTIARQNLGSLSSAWNSLTDGQRIGWNNFSYVNSDRFGRPITIKGKQAFVGLNTNLLNGLQPTINDAPLVVSGIVGQSNLTLSPDASSDEMLLGFEPDPTTASTVVLVYGTAPQRAGIFRPSQSKFRLFGILAAGTASGFDLAAQYKAKFGSSAISANAGAKIFIQTVVIENATGLASAISQVDAIIVA